MAMGIKLTGQQLTGHKKPQDIIGVKGLLQSLTKAVLERAQ